MDRIIRVKEFLTILGVSKSTFYSWQDKNSVYYKPNFPKKVSLGANSVGYFESDVNLYLNNIKNLNEVIYA